MPEDGVTPEGIGMMEDRFRAGSGQDHFHDVEPDRDVGRAQCPEIVSGAAHDPAFLSKREVVQRAKTKRAVLSMEEGFDFDEDQRESIASDDVDLRSGSPAVAQDDLEAAGDEHASRGILTGASDPPRPFFCPFCDLHRVPKAWIR